MGAPGRVVLKEFGRGDWKILISRTVLFLKKIVFQWLFGAQPVARRAAFKQVSFGEPKGSFGVIFSRFTAQVKRLFYCQKKYFALSIAQMKNAEYICGIVKLKTHTMKLFIREAGDMSAGIFPATWQVDCPFEADEQDEETLDWFKEQILSLYREFAGTQMTAYYEHEITGEP